MHRTRLPLRALAAALALGATFACASPRNFFAEYEKSLDTTYKTLEAGDPEGAARQAQDLLAATGGDAETFRVQRFYAVWLLTQAHVRASLGKPFIPEPPPPPSALSLGSSNARTERAETSHVVATMLYAFYGAEAHPKVRGASMKEGDTELLPPALRALSPDVLSDNLDLCRLVVYARLGFTEDIHGVLSRSPEMQTLEKANARMDYAHLDPGMRPWVHYTLFDFLKSRDEAEAFRFGVSAWNHAANTQGTLSEHELDTVARWLPKTSTYVFKCKQCKLQADPQMLRIGHCRNDQTPLLDFFPDRKSSTPPGS
jgi:hypothetical protein